MAAIELVFLALRKREKAARGLMALSAVVGIGASVFVFEAGALVSARTVQGPADQAMFASRQGVSVADAVAALGRTDCARAMLTALRA